MGLRWALLRVSGFGVRNFVELHKIENVILNIFDSFVLRSSRALCEGLIEWGLGSAFFVIYLKFQVFGSLMLFV